MGLDSIAATGFSLKLAECFCFFFRAELRGNIKSALFARVFLVFSSSPFIRCNKRMDLYRYRAVIDLFSHAHEYHQLLWSTSSLR